MDNKSERNRNYYYRSDIDGLRAIAIIGVVIFHFFPKFLSGGFVGVDIFFVISGYLVSGIIWRGINQNSFSITNFYIKRIRRIFPALILTFSCAVISGYIFLLADELKTFAKHLMASTLFFSNILYFQESGYFDKSAELKIFLNIWSLSLEEQFYIIWPLILIGIKKYFPKIKIEALILISFVSLLFCLYLTPNNKSFSFFMLPTRLWELSFGGVIAIAEVESRKRKSIDKIFEILKANSLILFIIGSCLVIYSMNKFDENILFPGKYAVLPVLGTILIILSGSNGLVSKILSNRLLVYIGILSYPIYLWHWPINSFINIYFHQSVPFGIKIISIIASIILSILTYEFIEKKFQSKKESKFLAFGLCIPVIVLFFVGLLTWKFDGFPWRYDEMERIRLSIKQYSTRDKPDELDKCKKKYLNIEMCAVYDEKKEPTVLLIGDSHAQHLFPALIDIVANANNNLLLLAQSGTPPFYDIISKRNPDVSLQNVFSYISKSPNVRTVILAGFWENYYKEEGVSFFNGTYKNIIEDFENKHLTKQKDIFILGLQRTIRFLKDKNKKIIFILDVPTVPINLELCLPRPFYQGEDICRFDKKYIINPQMSYREDVINILKADTDILIIDPFDFLCSDKCEFVNHKNILYSDSSHLSFSGSEHIKTNLEKSLTMKKIKNILNNVSK